MCINEYNKRQNVFDITQTYSMIINMLKKKNQLELLFNDVTNI